MEHDVLKNRDAALIGRRQAAPADCEGLTNDDLNGSAELHKVHTALFDKRQIAEIAALVTTKNSSTSLKPAQSVTAVGEA